MRHAYDFVDLREKLKARGLDLGEEAAKGVLEDVLAWVEESSRLSATPFDDVAVVVIPPLKKMALEAIDKLDGQVG